MEARSLPRQAGASRALENSTQRVGAFVGLPALIDSLGVPAAEVLAAAGLPLAALAQADNRIPFKAYGRVLQAAARMTRLNHFGLTAGRMVRLDDLGIVGTLVRNATSVAEAIQFMVVHRHLNSEGDLVFVASRRPIVEVSYAIYYPAIAGANQLYDYALASLFGMLRELAGPQWVPSQVFLPHARPPQSVHYRNLFRVQPSFDSEFCSLRFPAYWLDRPVAGADPAQRRRALEVVQQAADPDLMQQVYRAVRELLLCGKSSGNDVAGMLSMHRRTLNRRLRARGTTFQQVLDDVRSEVARQLLGDSQLPLAEIAASLGYAGVSPFTRRFRRWTGLSPGAVRKSMCARGSDLIQDQPSPVARVPTAPRLRGQDE